MKTLKNKILNKIYTRFMEKKIAYKTSILDKILTYTPILNSFKLIDNNFEASLSSITIYVMSSSLIFFPISKHFSSHNISHWDNLFLPVGVGIFFMFICYAIVLRLLFINKKEKHEQEYKSKPLSVEDFNDVINNVNEKIVGKLLEENNQKITYGDLEKLDELLLKEKETLAKIEHEKMAEILGKIDMNVLVEKFKDKDMNEIVDSLKKSGLDFKDTEQLIKKDILNSKIVKSEKQLEVLFS